MNGPSADWQAAAASGLARLDVGAMPAMELVYLDALAVHLLGPEAPAPPYTVEHGSAIVSLLLRAVIDAPLVEDLESGTHDADDAAAAPARQAVVAGAHALGSLGGIGVRRLVTRFLTAAVGELEQHKDAPEAQVRSLFHYGLLAIASGPDNQTNAATSDSVLAAFDGWDRRIGDGFVPPWRVVA